MSDKDRDQIIWDTIISFYKEEKIDKDNNKWSLEQLEQARKENQEKAYWCREKGDDQNLFNKPEQRLMARFVKSFLNTSYKGDFKQRAKEEKWFDNPYIIEFSESLTKSSNTNKNEVKLINFITDARDLLTRMTQLKNCVFKKEQKDNLKALREIVDQEFNRKNPQVSDFEKTFLDHITKERNNSAAAGGKQDDSVNHIPVDLIFKMQKLIRGFGIALTCDFLKESHLCNIAKPDVHLRHVFSMIDGIPYSEDLILVKRISEFAKNVGKNSNPDDFCNSGPYYIDKIIWMLCSRNKYYKDKNGKEIPIPDFKKQLLDRIVEKLQEID